MKVALAIFFGLVLAGCSERPMIEATEKDVEHALIVHLPMQGGDFGGVDERKAVFALEDELISAVELAEAGEYDGNEFGGGEAVLFIYGTNADRLFELIGPILARSNAAADGYAVKRYGPATDPSAKEIRVTW